MFRCLDSCLLLTSALDLSDGSRVAEDNVEWQWNRGLLGFAPVAFFKSFLATTNCELTVPSLDATGTSTSDSMLKTCITVTTTSDISKYNMPEAQPVCNEHVRLLRSTLPQIVQEYGESSITMSVVYYSTIHAKVCAFWNTVSSEYLQQYVKFHSQRS